MIKGFLILFILPLAICLSCLFFWDFINKIDKYKKYKKK